MNSICKHLVVLMFCCGQLIFSTGEAVAFDNEAFEIEQELLELEALLSEVPPNPAEECWFYVRQAKKFCGSENFNRLLCALNMGLAEDWCQKDVQQISPLEGS